MSGYDTAPRDAPETAASGGVAWRVGRLGQGARDPKRAAPANGTAGQIAALQTARHRGVHKTMVPITPGELLLLKRRIKQMPRDRHQQGWVEETGKRVKKWRGLYYACLGSHEILL